MAVRQPASQMEALAWQRLGTEDRAARRQRVRATRDRAGYTGMTSVDAATSEANPRAVPYVGLRAFRPDEHDRFYGRDADAQFLVDKILSARLTLLYAPSGVGKSSLLRARVMAALEVEGCRVTYFDAWAGSDPLSALKEKLAELAVSAGVSDPLAGAPTLPELVQLSASDGRTVVLVLDQFEEFLINHAQRLDPLRTEIAALIKAHAVDARVLISFREEFLAAIEPFRQEILTLFQSTYRLENLSADRVEKAIVEPAAKFGGDVAEDLVKRLIADLSESGDAAVKPALDPHAVDLPMLQLVCEDMWRAAPLVGGRKALTLDFYQRLGGKKKILDDHIRSRMPSRWRDRLFTAKLMRFLAPPSGLKISYSAADLAEYSHFDRTRVEAELERLSGPDTRILRKRDFRDSVRFELQHDALIRHVTPWRDAVLHQAYRHRRVARAAVAAEIVLAVVIVAWLYRWKEVRDNTVNRLNALREMSSAEKAQHAGNTFEAVAN